MSSTVSLDMPARPAVFFRMAPTASNLEPYNQFTQTHEVSFFTSAYYMRLYPLSLITWRVENRSIFTSAHGGPKSHQTRVKYMFLKSERDVSQVGLSEVAWSILRSFRDFCWNSRLETSNATWKHTSRWSHRCHVHVQVMQAAISSATRIGLIQIPVTEECVNPVKRNRQNYRN